MVRPHANLKRNEPSSDNIKNMATTDDAQVFIWLFLPKMPSIR